METFLSEVCSPEWNERQDAGRPFAEAVAELAPKHPDKLHLINAWRERFPEMIRPRSKGTVDVLRELKASSVPVYALSNWSAETFPSARERFPFLAWFDGIVLSGAERCMKPDERIFRILLDRYGLAAGETVFIDDNPKNAHAAGALGNPRNPFPVARRAAPRAWRAWSHVNGDDPRALSFALVGAGFIGPVHAANVAARSDTRLAWVVDVDPNAGAALAGKHGARFTVDLGEALADDAVDAVLVCTPPRTHAAIIERAARAGKAIFCEKPVDLEMARIDACARVLAETRVPFHVGFNRRYDPSHLALHDAIRNGDIGRAEMLVLSSRDPEISPPDYVAAMPNGIFYDTIIHDFDMVRWLTATSRSRWSRAPR
jgi:HAD superfamily hydrolase (TIGR01509 family)